MVDELSLLLSAKSMLVMLLAPSMVVGLLLIILAYKLLDKLGSKFIASQEKQTQAFERIANSVEHIQAGVDSTIRSNDDIRITLTAMSEKINNIYDTVNRRDA